AAIAALEEGAAVAQSLTLSHGFLLLHIGPLDEAIEWLERIEQGEPDPHRRAFAKLGIARAHAWSGRTSEALAECDGALALLEPSPVPRFVLPIRCLRHSLDGSVVEAVTELENAHLSSAPFERAEAALDVGDGLLRHGALCELV